MAFPLVLSIGTFHTAKCYIETQSCSRTHRFVVTIRVLAPCLGTLAIAETGGICPLSQEKSDGILPYSMLNAIVKWGNNIIC